MKMFFLLCAAFLLLGSCSSAPNVNRVDAERQIDLSGFWNDTDVRIVCRALVAEAVNSPRVEQAIARRGGRTPTVIVGTFRNISDEQIDTSIISTIMEIEIFNSGKLNFVAGGATRDELRAERLDQQGQASEDTVSALANETGADFLLTGTVRTIVDRAGNQSVRTYFVNAEMTDIETNDRIWMGMNNEIKKTVRQPRHRL